MTYIIKKFKDYCEANGIELMREDLRFIERALCKMPQQLHSEALRGYIASWRRTMAKENSELVGVNSARREANKFLLFFTDDK